MRGAEHPLRLGCPAYDRDLAAARQMGQGTSGCRKSNIAVYLYSQDRLEHVMNRLIAQAAAADFESRAVMPVRELGAYEVFWAQAPIARNDSGDRTDHPIVCGAPHSSQSLR
jgi:hypothetical protein